MNGYKLSREWWDFCFENPEKITPSHSAIYFFAIEHCNRLGWKSKFGFPTSMAMDAIGIKKHETYIKYFYDLCDWGFFILVQKSTNQYSSNIISLASGFTKNGKALGKAILKHKEKQTQPNGESNGSIDKPLTKEQLTIELRKKAFGFSLKEFEKTYPKDMLTAFFRYWSEKNKSGTKMKWELEKTFELSLRLSNWAAREKDFDKPQGKETQKVASKPQTRTQV